MPNSAEHFTAARQSIEVEATSKRGFVTVTRDRSGDIRVRIRKGMFDLLDHDQIEADITSALVSALAKHQAAVSTLTRQYLGG